MNWTEQVEQQRYVDLYGAMPGPPEANHALEAELAPEYLGRLERLRESVFFDGPLDLKTVQLVCLALELTQPTEAAYWHARGARRQGASWEELHQVVALAGLLRGLGASHAGCAVLLRLRAERES